MPPEPNKEGFPACDINILGIPSSTVSGSPPPKRSPPPLPRRSSSPPTRRSSSPPTKRSSPPQPKGVATLSPKILRSDSVRIKRPANGNLRNHSNSRPEHGTHGTPPRRRIPSLKLKRISAQNRSDKFDSTMPCLEPCGRQNPSITITIDSDDESVYSDYLSPDINYKREMKVQYIGDETSLYGTPKEELLPSNNNSNMDKTSATTFLREQITSFFQPSDNKLAMKLFGNKNALLKEKMRHKRAGSWVIHPCSDFR